jgi:hypothetical protein
MNIFGCILFTSLGILLIITLPQLLKFEEKDYSKFSVTTGQVLHEEYFTGCRWIVEFTDENGNEAIGMDDINSYNSFNYKKYTLPKFGTAEEIFYWRYNGKSEYSINGKRVYYYIHFCNERFYDLQRALCKRNCIIGIVIGCSFIIAGILILLFS